MRKFCRNFGLTVICLLVFSSGVFLVYSSIYNPKLLTICFAFIQLNPLVCQAIGAILVLLVLGVLNTLSRSGVAHSGYVTFKSEAGSVSISCDALQRFVDQVVAEFNAAVDITSNIVPTHSNSVNIVIQTRLRAGNSVAGFSELLQDRVRDTLRNDLGISNIAKIKVIITGISGDPRPTPPPTI